MPGRAGGAERDWPELRGPARPGPAEISMLRAVVRGSRLCPALLRAPFSAAAASPIPAPNPRPDIAYNKVGPSWEPGQPGRAGGFGAPVPADRAQSGAGPARGEAEPGAAGDLGPKPWKKAALAQPRVRGTGRVSHRHRALSLFPRWVHEPKEKTLGKGTGREGKVLG